MNTHNYILVTSEGSSTIPIINETYIPFLSSIQLIKDTEIVFGTMNKEQTLASGSNKIKYIWKIN